MNDEQPRRSNVPLGIARNDDIARRGLVGFHKRKVTDESTAAVDQTGSELKPFEHDKRAIYMTNENSVYVANAQIEYLKSCDPTVPEETILGTTPVLPLLAPLQNWSMYKILNFMEAGRIINMVIRGTYNGGKTLAATDLLLLRRHPNDPQFTQEDILLYSPSIALNPHPFTGPGFGGDWAVWYSQGTNIIFDYPFSRIRGQAAPGQPITDLATQYTLYILVENIGMVGGGGIAPEIRFDLYVEDRGR